MRQTRWLREFEFRNGAMNMAIDSAIAESVAERASPPTLRVYGWQPFCLSLGYGQRACEADASALEARGWELVRRPTGGKAILHGDELTYSLCLPDDAAISSGDVVESYRRISVGLLCALEELGLAASARHQDNVERQSVAGPVCFAMPSHYEITVADKKLIGSAQLRQKGVVLQHGTIPLRGDVARICDVLRFDLERDRLTQAQQVRQRALALEQVMGRAPSWDEVATALERGFSRAFDLDLRPGQLSQRESARAAALVSEKYGNAAWINRR